MRNLSLRSRQVYRLGRRSRAGLPPRSRNGAYTVEFALVCSLFFMVTFAGIEFSRFMYARHSVDQAAYEATRAGIVPGATAAQVLNTANRILNATGVRKATVQVTPATLDSNTQKVTVTIRCSYSDSSFMGPLFLGATQIESTMTLDHENSAYLPKAQVDIGDNLNEPQDI
jgi:Flp pilus assembly protein TadG